jgi:hypothetical protein
LLLFLAVLFASSCGESEPELSPTPASTPTPLAPPAPTVLTADVHFQPENSLIAWITGTVDAPGHVYVEYWNDDHGRFRSKPQSVDGVSFTAYATRLRANLTYHYQVFGTDLNGGTTDGPTGTFQSGPLPDVLAEARFTVLSGQPTRPITFMDYRQAGYFGLVAFDGNGQVVWYYKASEGDGEQPHAMVRKPNGNIVYIAGFQGGTTSLGLVEIDPTGKEVNRLVGECSPFSPIHHEVQILPDGRVMYLARDVLWEGYGDPLHPQEGDTIGIWDPATGENEIVWNIFDHISPADRTEPDSDRRLPGFPVWGGCDRDRSVQDWSHANSVMMAEDGSVILSLRHLDQIVSISPDFQSIQWRLGGPGSDFMFPNPIDRFYEQHSAVPLPNGNILLFDNGNDRPREEGGQYSRPLELQLDHNNKTATAVWQFLHNPLIFSVCCSSVERLPNGNTLFLYGTNFRPDPRPFKIMEAAPDGEVAWEVVHVSPGKQNQYRIYSADSIMDEERLD